MKAHNTEPIVHSPGRIFVISGPSGSGKTTLLERLLKNRKLKNLLERSVSVTTRSARRGEKNGRDYFFVSAGEFRRMQREEKILESTKYLGYYYGTPRGFVEERLGQGKFVALCLDTAGAKHIKRAYPAQAVTIFIAPPSLEALRQRIHGRGRETVKAEIKKRLGMARQELREAQGYDHCLVNDDFSRAAIELKRIVLKYKSSG